LDEITTLGGTRSNMAIKIGELEALFRYPVKSMRGETVVRERDNKAGVYGTVIRCGRLTVGQSIYFRPGVG
jgi:hypothetical protein